MRSWKEEGKLRGVSTVDAKMEVKRRVDMNMNVSMNMDLSKVRARTNVNCEVRTECYLLGT